jgi:hypothetical protein
MRRIGLIAVLALLSAVVSTAAQGSSARAEQDLIGKWSGSFTGEGTSGKWSMAVSRDAAKKLTGTLQAMPDGGDGFTVPFKSITVKGKEVALVYDQPGGEGEVHLDATIEGKGLKGTWQSMDAAKKPVQRGNFEGTKP